MQNLTTKIFEKNIDCLKDFELKNALLNYLPKNAVKLENTNGYNLNYDGIYLHNTTSPLGEAQSIINSCVNMNSQNILIFGLGLGYLFQLAYRNLKGKIVLFEPDLEIIYTTFNYVDFSLELSDERVSFTNNFDNFIKTVQMNLQTKESPLILSLKSYRDLNQTEFESQIDAVKMIFGSNIVDNNFKSRNYYLMAKNLVNNIPDLLKEAPLHHFKNIYKGKTALIAGAGPSLDRNIETIKNNRDKFIIFAVGTALRSMLSNGIVPDFLTIIELFDCSKQIKDIDLSQVNYIIEPYSNPVLHQVNAKRIFSHITNNVDINKLWAEMCRFDNSDYYSSGTVTFSAMDSARILGCSKIVTVGLDLAFSKGRCYSKDSIYKDLVFDYDENNQLKIVAKDFKALADALYPEGTEEEKILHANNRIEDLNKNLFYVKGVTGEMLPTYKDYALFIQHFTRYSKMFPDFEYINCSMTGAQIDGFKNESLEEVVKNLPVVQDKEINSVYNYDTESIVSNLNKHSESLNSYLEVLRNNINGIDQFLQKLEVSQERLNLCGEEISIFKDLVNVFNMITTDESNKLFYCISMYNKYNCRDELYKTDVNSVQSVKNSLNELRNYYSKCTEFILDIKNDIAATVERIKGRI